MKPVIEAYQSGHFPRACDALEPLIADRRDSEKDRTIYELEAGSVYAAAGDLAKSMRAFASADERMWEYLDSSADLRISEQAVALASNQTIIRYTGRTYDRIMCSTYQALNHLARGDLGSAGVSLRRAYEWQRDAVEKNAKEIEGLQAKADEKAQSSSYNTTRAMENGQFKSGLDSAYGPVREMKGYAEFAIPYSTYLQALQFQLTGRSEALAQATVAFRRVAGMLSTSDRAYALQDAADAEAAARGEPRASTVYVLCETGMGPWLKELRLDIPLFMQKLPYVGAAFPVLKFKEGAVSGFTVRAAAQRYSSSLLTDMDRVVAGEFSERLPAIIALTLVSSASKAIATYFAQEAASRSDGSAGLFVALAGAIYQVSVNSADLRIWLTLPKQVLYARFPAPSSGSIELDLGDGQKIGPISVESKGTTIVHLRTPAAGVVPVVRTMRFPN